MTAIAPMPTSLVYRRDTQLASLRNRKSSGSYGFGSLISNEPSPDRKLSVGAESVLSELDTEFGFGTLDLDDDFEFDKPDAFDPNEYSGFGDDNDAFDPDDSRKTPPMDWWEQQQQKLQPPQLKKDPPQIKTPTKIQPPPLKSQKKDADTTSDDSGNVADMVSTPVPNYSTKKKSIPLFSPIKSAAAIQREKEAANRERQKVEQEAMLERLRASSAQEEQEQLERTNRFQNAVTNRSQSLHNNSSLFNNSTNSNNSNNPRKVDFGLLARTMTTLREPTVAPPWGRPPSAPVPVAADSPRKVSSPELNDDDYEDLDVKAIEAAKWTDGEIRKLIQIIQDIGQQDDFGNTFVHFGILFDETADVFDALSGICKTAKKYKVVAFDPEQLWQGQHDMEPVTLLKDTHDGIEVKRRKKLSSVRSNTSIEFRKESQVNQNSQCHICAKTVYPMEYIGASAKSFHKNCFRCTKCKKKLSQNDYCVGQDSNFRCAAHHREYEMAQL